NMTHFVVVEKFKNEKVTIVDPAKGKLKISRAEFEKNFSNAIICSTIEPKKERKKLNKNKSLINILKENKTALLWTVAFSFLLQLLTLYIPIYMKGLIDSYHSVRNFNNLILVLFLVLAFYYSFSLIKMRLITSFHNNFDRALTSKTVSHLLKLPLKFFVNRGKGELIFTINSNQYIRALISTQMISLFMDVVFLVLYLLLMFFYSFELTLITVTLGVILVGISIINTKMIMKKNQTQITNIADIQNITGEIVSNISTIKAIGSEEEIFQKWSNGFEKQLQMEKEKAGIDSILGNIPSTIQVTYSLIIIIVGIMIGRESGLSIGTIVAFNTLGASFLSPMLSIANSYLQLSAAKIYINQLLDLINSKTENLDNDEENIEIQNGEIKFTNISFKYDYFSENVLNGINIDIKSGEKVAIVGESGSGKSTLLMLIAGLYEPTEGIIQVGRQYVNQENVNIRFYRKQLGIVLQESMLFNGTIKENILMGRNADIEEINKAVMNSNLEKFVNSFPSKMDTIISENGNNMSGGQRQRLCIARALLKNPKILLMDEPTSSLDNISENSIMDNLFKMNSTILVIAHRLANIAKFDKIIVMDQGKIVSVGSHEDLLRHSTHYRELYEVNIQNV
ncbi:MAG: transporter, partial [Neobacillus sp.]|nr:transporter [Neobacillus sp.]